MAKYADKRKAAVLTPFSIDGIQLGMHGNARKLIERLFEQSEHFNGLR